MPPNKPKLYTSTGKPTVRPIEHISPDSEQAQKFELELCWCIQQLQLALNSGKLNNKQSQDHTKSLNTLMSNNAPMVKKRQIMRSSFGDYRMKMADEEKNVSKNAHLIKMKPSAAPSEKSVFVKRRTFSSTLNNFKFNFKTPEGCYSDSKQDKVTVSNELGHAKNKECNLAFSDNSFRFNFDSSSS
ncbi:unnamed protein product [Phaedon cochleariae]|uniref:Uncharacterized protein n=1 Tax=Phaedon cochleariae TaxID=80249 RepID=A0A9P0DJJ2_PHACE|nr:unnamed protein product [Phaedon cochleariae]